MTQFRVVSLPINRRQASIISPLRYPGAKRRLSGYIAETLKLNSLRPKLLVEPFAGGLSVALQLLNDKFPGIGTLAHRLRVTSLLVFLNEIPEVEIYGDNPLDQYICFRREVSQSPRIQDRPKVKEKVAPKKRPTLTATYEKKDVEAKARDLAVLLVVKAEEKGNRELINYLGLKLNKKFPGEGKLWERLGYESLIKFLKSIPDLEVYKDNRGKYVRSRMQDPTPSADSSQQPKQHSHAHVRQEGLTTPPPASPYSSEVEAEIQTSPGNRVNAKTLVLKLVSEAASLGKDLTVIQIASALDKEIPGQGKMAMRLGYKTFPQFLEDIPEIETYGVEPRRYVRLCSGEPKPESETIALSTSLQQTPQDPKDDAKALAVRLVKEASARGNEMRVLLLASLMSKHLSGEGSISNRLGYETFSQFLSDVPELEIYGIEPKRYVRFSNGEETVS